jgi:heptosyltransferase-2
VCRVLVIRFSSIGDIILTAPVIKALRQANPDMTVDYLVHERFQSLVGHFDPPPQNIVAFPSMIGARQLGQYARNLATTGYDIVIDLHDSLRSRILRRAFRGMDMRIYRKPRYNRFLLFYLWINHFPPDFSIVGEYLRFSGLKLPVLDRRPRLYLSSLETDSICTRFGLSDNYLTCIPGATWRQKSWIPERYVQLYTHLLRMYSDLDIVLVGGPADDICDQIAGGLKGSRVMNLKGRTSIQEVLGILSRSRLVVGSDTGFIHAAEALDIPIVMILGPTSRETGAISHNPRSHVHEVSLGCRPCSQNGKRRCYRSKQYCLTNISVEDILTSVEQIIGSA